eukprot:m.268198 g.268198  ORF g.268198 m.268198 type:complete len:636 (-) comp22806_c6_seq4:32-1939(-)
MSGMRLSGNVTGAASTIRSLSEQVAVLAQRDPSTMTKKERRTYEKIQKRLRLEQIKLKNLQILADARAKKKLRALAAAAASGNPMTSAATIATLTQQLAQANQDPSFQALAVADAAAAAAAALALPRLEPCWCHGGSTECFFVRQDVRYQRGDCVYVSSLTHGRAHFIARILKMHDGAFNHGSFMTVQWYIRNSELPPTAPDHFFHMDAARSSKLLHLTHQQDTVSVHLLRGKCQVTDLALEDSWEIPQGLDSFVSIPCQFFLPSEQLRAFLNGTNLIDQSFIYEPLLTDRETLVWDAARIDLPPDFLCAARSAMAVRRAQLNPNLVLEDALVGAERDKSMEHALHVLHANEYDCDKAYRTLLCEDPVNDELEKWSDRDRRLFIEAMFEHDKHFHLVREKYLPHKKTTEIVEYYYQWKSTESYQVYREETKGRLKPRPPPLSTNVRGDGYMTDDSTVKRAPRGRKKKKKGTRKLCAHCGAAEMQSAFYPGGPQQEELCHNCRSFWKRQNELPSDQYIVAPEGSDSDHTEAVKFSLRSKAKQESEKVPVDKAVAEQIVSKLRALAPPQESENTATTSAAVDLTPHLDATTLTHIKNTQLSTVLERFGYNPTSETFTTPTPAAELESMIAVLLPFTK